MEEDVSVYDIADHPDFHFRTTDIVIRIWNAENGQNDCENEVRMKNVLSSLQFGNRNTIEVETRQSDIKD